MSSDKPRDLFKGDLPLWMTFEPRFETHRLLQVEVIGRQESRRKITAEVVGHGKPDEPEIFYKLTNEYLYLAMTTKVGQETCMQYMEILPRSCIVMTFGPRV